MSTSPSSDGHWLAALVILVGATGAVAVILDGTDAAWAVALAIIAAVICAFAWASHRP